LCGVLPTEENLVPECPQTYRIAENVQVGSWELELERRGM
jgi:hypothetical protein